jgi:hypothetical protein
VIASNRGALPEIVEHEKPGYFSLDENDLGELRWTLRGPRQATPA